MWAMKMNFTRSHQMIPHVQISPSSLPPDPLLKHSQESSTGLSRGSSTFAIYSQPYLDSYNECYFNLVTLSTFPAGPISSYVRKISFPPLSEFQTFSSACTTRKQCGWALRKINGPEVDVGMGGSSCCRGDLMTVNEVPQLFEFLMSHEYKIDTSLTKMMNTSPVSLKGNAGNSGDLIAFVTFLSKESK